ncbi:hypothetical protein [Terrabacter sp. NPDC080008]|uniref:hypothetical protein n=1 Tax=Terrabacter sp. NPDC080008 TaxID=3155176 RepID=UPI003450D303
MFSKRITAAALAVGAGVVMAAATPASAATNYVAGPYSSLTKCNSVRTTYVKDGGFSYVGSCYKQTNNYYYFQYR